MADARDAVRDAERYKNNLEAGSRQTDIDSARADVILLKDRLEDAREDYQPYERKDEDNVKRATFLSKLADAQEAYNNAVRLLNNLQGSASELDTAIAEADLAVAQAQLELAEQQYEKVKGGPDPDDLEAVEARIRAAEALAPREEDFLAHFQILSRQYPEDMARDALELAILRREAAVKFPFADHMFFTREALEQASPWKVASCRASRFRNFERLVDLGCSIGADSLALAGVAPTLGIDIDPLRLHMAQANAKAMGFSDGLSFLQADLVDPLPIKCPQSSTGLFFDPARRAGGRRAYSRSGSCRIALPPTWTGSRISIRPAASNRCSRIAG